MNREFNFIDMYYMNDFTSDKKSPIQFLYSENLEPVNRNSFVEIYSDTEDSLMCTLAKFLEIMDSQGLEGLSVL